MKRLLLLGYAAWMALGAWHPRAALAQNTNQFELIDGDRVVLLGDTLIEREARYGHWEYLFTVLHAQRHVTFRNLGWSGDTPLGQSRVSFDHDKGPDFWFRQLTNQVAQVRPTVVFLGYGMANSFQGAAGLPGFTNALERLMDAIQRNADATVRFVLLSPIAHEMLPPPAPDPTPHNEQLKTYAEAIRAVAQRRQAYFIDLFALMTQPSLRKGAPPLTDDGIHLSEYGYRRSAEDIARALKFEPNMWRIGLRADGTVRQDSHGIKVSESSRSDTNARMVAVAQSLVSPNLKGYSNQPPLTTPVCRWQAAGLKTGKYDLMIDGQFMETVDSVSAQGGLFILRGPFFEQAEELRQAILKKNELFFHRWRPQNNTYLFLFRKHEQGQNAKEIPQFDPLIEAQEKEIARLRVPLTNTFELVPSTGERRRPDAPPKPVLASLDMTPLPPPQFDVDPNLEITLYAENPLLAKPIHMNFDSLGRLWVASSEVYPQIKPGQAANDKILVLEDLDGDGRAEKSTIFADGLLIPTGVEPGDGGVYVGQSTELLHLKDTDGDGQADQRRVVLGAFGTEDTHHILHTLRWGFDGQLYINQSIYIHTHAETPHGVTRLNSGGILNLRLPTMELGIHAKGLVNSWGHAFDAWGQSFMTDGASSADAGQGGIFYVVPQGMYFTYAGARRILNSVSPGSYPKFCGLEYIASRHFPDDWQGSFVTCDFRAHRITRFAISEKDSAYVTEERPDLVRTKDVAFRPIDVKLGPDGALYIADWSNPIIQHGEVDFRDPRRDHEHGRIWRVSYKGRALVKDAMPGKLRADFRARAVAAQQANEPASDPTSLIDELFAGLLSPNGFTRTQSRRVLTEMAQAQPQDLVGHLLRLTSVHTNDDAKLQLLWLSQAFDFVNPSLLESLLESRDGRIRAAAVRTLSFWQQRLPVPANDPAFAWKGWPSTPLPLKHRVEIPTERALTWLAARVADEHPRVRLEAVRALARIPTARAADVALSVLNKPMDAFLDYALWLTISDLSQPWLDALQSGAWNVEGREKQLEFGLKAVEPAQASRVLGKLLGDKPLPRDGSGPWIDLIGQAGAAPELRRLFDQVMTDGFDSPAAARALGALNQSARLRKTKPGGDTLALGKLFTHADDSVRVAAVRLAGTWKDLGPYFASVGRFAGGKDTSPELRAASFDTIREIGGQSALATLTPMVAKSNNPAVRRPAVLALASVNLERAVPSAVEVLNEVSTDADALGLWRSLLSIKGAAPALAKALPKTGLSPVMAKAGLRAAREGGRNEPDLILALTRGAGLEEGDVALTDAELKQLVADVASQGDPVRGEAVYRRKELGCVACHAIGGAGGKVGPDMTSLGASAPIDYLIESVWFPNKKIKEGYHALQIETQDGQEFSGVLVSENSEQVILRDAGANERTVAKNQISRRTTSTTSLMPAGLLDPLAPRERIDLFRFLSELGKPGPFDATRGGIARVWRVRPGVHTLEQFGEDKIVSGDLAAKEWVSMIGRVDGHLPSADIRENLSIGKYLGLVGIYAGAQLQVAKAGAVKLKFTGTTSDTPVWIDGKPATSGSEVEADLAAGNHTIVVRLDARKLPETLRLEASEGTFVTQ